MDDTNLSFGEPVLGIDGVRALENEREPVSERLRLHYIGGAHVGLRGEWARLIRLETATLAEISRRYRRLRRDLRDADRVGQYLPTGDEEIPF